MREIILWCKGQIEWLKQFKDWESHEHICGRISAFEDVIKEIEQIKQKEGK